jgi:hypothetical protein
MRTSGASDSELTLGRAQHPDEAFHGQGLLVLAPFDVGDRGGDVDARNRLRRLAVDERRGAVVVRPFCDSHATTPGPRSRFQPVPAAGCVRAYSSNSCSLPVAKNAAPICWIVTRRSRSNMTGSGRCQR